MNGADALNRLRKVDPAAKVVAGLPFPHPDVQDFLAAGTFAALRKPVAGEAERDMLRRVTASPSQAPWFRCPHGDLKLM
ncbi:MAG TPA: hypothetical protein VGR28_08880 [Candidatus Thermoplasmatota archaeon]|jgi:hypothetical protein|nr:hypothetical protein [Candidatus Thermoplasmatota archaeon]